MRLTIFLAFLAGLSVTPALAADAETLERKPYYLSLHEPMNEESRGTVVMLHGGGWNDRLGKSADELMESYIDLVRGWGYSVANLGYRPGLRGLDDAEAAFQAVRKLRGSNEPICIFGTSAGAQLGLIVAARRDDVDCVIDLLGPPDLTDLGSRPRSAEGEKLAKAAFGASRLAELSPINSADQIEAPVVVGAATCDALIEFERMQAFVDAVERAGGDARLSVIEKGEDLSLEHCVVTQASFDRFLADSRELLDEVGRPPKPIETADPAPPDASDSSPVGAVLGVIVTLAALVLLIFAWRR